VVVVISDIMYLSPSAVAGEKTIDLEALWKAIRKLSAKNTMVVINSLCNKGKTFRDIQKDTGLLVNDLNHALYDLKQLNLVIVKGDRKGERFYHLTEYCVILLNAIGSLQGTLKQTDAKEIFSAYDQQLAATTASPCASGGCAPTLAPRTIPEFVQAP